MTSLSHWYITIRVVGASVGSGADNALFLEGDLMRASARGRSRQSVSNARRAIR